MVRKQKQRNADLLVLYSCKDKNWKIADFGLTMEGTSTGGVGTKYSRGTPGYRAPELIIGARYTNKVDIWSLGSILYQLIFSRKLFLDDLEVRDYYSQTPRKNLQLPSDNRCTLILDELSKEFLLVNLRHMLDR